MSLDLVGKWAFLIGLIIAVIAGFIPGYPTTYGTTILLVLFVLGLLVGLLNITEKNSMKFLVAILTLLTIGVGGISVLSVVLGEVNKYLTLILGNFIAFVGAAGLVVSIKCVIETGQK